MDTNDPTETNTQEMCMNTEAPLTAAESPLGRLFALLSTPDDHETPDYGDDAIDELHRWWTDSAWDEAEQTIAKMQEYGSGDLVALGQLIRRLSHLDPLPAVEAMQLGCLMYLAGKLERAVEAVRNGRPVSADTWFDIRVYAKMADAAACGVWQIDG